MRVQRNRDTTDKPAESVTVSHTWEGSTGEHGSRIRVEPGYGDLHIEVELGSVMWDPKRPNVIIVREA
jgi:hypothetical protein